MFGQHVHIGVRSGDEAVRLAHALARYVPHFIALSASSPFAGGADTQFDSSRLNVVNAFPLAGFMPYVADWDEFEHYFGEMQGFGIVESMKDFYWDIRPKPEYGTIEIRVFDTPLTVARAAELAAYAQALAARVREDPGWSPHPSQYLVYSYNRFQACRFGFGATIVDPVDPRAPAAGGRDRRHADPGRAPRRAAGRGRRASGVYSTPPRRGRTTPRCSARCSRSAARSPTWCAPRAPLGTDPDGFPDRAVSGG